MQKQRLVFLIIVISLALSALILTKVYLDNERKRIVEEAKKKLASVQANLISVLAAKKDIPPGSTIDPNSLESKIVPKEFVQPQAVTAADRISGMIAVAPISKGEQITLSKLSHPKSAGGGGGGGLAEATPLGKRAITIPVDNISTFVGMIKPGDYVDIIVQISVPLQTPEGKQVNQVVILPLFQNVLTLAVGQEISSAAAQKAIDYRYKQPEEKKAASPFITLALSPQEANLLAFIQEQGKIRLLLRSPADSGIQQVQPASWDTLSQYFMPRGPSQPQDEKKEPQDQQEYVEIYRGLKKERIPLSK